jgi:hypothetical protein
LPFCVKTHRLCYSRKKSNTLRQANNNTAFEETGLNNARESQRQRFNQDGSSPLENLSNLTCNSDMHPAEVRKYCQLDATSSFFDAFCHESDAVIRPRLSPCAEIIAHHC